MWILLDRLVLWLVEMTRRAIAVVVFFFYCFCRCFCVHVLCVVLLCT